MVFSAMDTICESLNQMPGGLKMSCPQIASMVPFVNISNFFMQNNIYIMTFRVARWDILDNSLAI